MRDDQIVMIHGTAYKEMTIQLLEQIRLAEMIGDCDRRVAMKPNLVTDTTAASGAVTHPEILDGLLTYLQDRGFGNLEVMEGSWVGAHTMDAAKMSGILAVCQAHDVPFIDLQKDGHRKVNAAGMELQVCKKALQDGFLINLPVVKGHCQTTVTCAMKNLKGLIPNTEKRRFHSLGLHKPIAHLAAAIRPDLILADNICGDLDFEEGGNPVPMDRIFCCTDPVLCDAFACQIMGVPVSDAPYIEMAEKLGVGSTDLTRVEMIALNEGVVGQNKRLSRRVRELAGYAAPKDACSACYGMLIHALDKMDRCGVLWGHQEKICIGQGYRGQEGEIGVGSCTGKCRLSLQGCPPTAAQILEFLNENWI